MCSSNVSDTANRLLKRTNSEGSSSVAEEKSSAVPLFRSGHMSAICARLSKGKGKFTRGWKPQVSTLLCPRRVGALPAEVQRKPPRPLGANTLTQFASPGQPVPKKPPARFAFSRLPYAEKTKKAPLTRCLSLLRICQPLSSSSCRNYRSRRRYYHHRYRRNRSRRCPDRSIPRSG